jgi:hypothetical protein
MKDSLGSPAAELLPFEREHFHLEYQKYFETKRANFFRSIHVFQELWDCFQTLNDIWQRDIEDTQHLHDPKQMMPSLLFRYAHARFLIATELGFSCCIGDAFGSIRGGIEAVAQGHKIHREPHLAKVWTERGKGRAEDERYKQAFEHNKKTSLFPSQHGFERLHECWKWSSELGSHSNVVAVGKGFEEVIGDGKQTWVFHHFETDPRKLATFLFALLMASSEMEQVFYKCFEQRLQLDTQLGDKRGDLRQRTKQQGEFLRKKYSLTGNTFVSELNEGPKARSREAG